jgi:acetyltransferase-like isoleucine patch superfamily enzyme
VIRDVLTLTFGLLPRGKYKNLLLRTCGHSVHQTCQISPIILSKVGNLTLAKGSVLQAGSFFRNLTNLHLGENAFIGKFNHVYADSGFPKIKFAGHLRLAPGSYVTNRHELDCSGGIILGQFSAIAGSKSVLQTHSIDFSSNKQTNAPITIGDRSFIGTSCLILMGSVFPSQSILGAGSLLQSHFSSDREGIFVGRPAKWLKQTEGDWFSRSNPHTNEYG